MKKLFILFTVLILNSIPVFAFDYVSEVVLLDGSHIKQCRLQNGTIDYCTPSDELNAKRAMQNPDLLPNSQTMTKYAKANSTIQFIGNTTHIINTTVNDIRAITNIIGINW